MRRFGLVLVFLSLTISAVAACGGETTIDPAAEPIATSAAVPTFTRVTVTPVPIDTPEPTATAEPAIQFTAEQLADPIFPDWLDPELNDEQPEDEVVFDGWQDHLTNTVMEFANDFGGRETVNLCEHGVVVGDDGIVDDSITWGATRTAAMSSAQWGMIALTGTSQQGRNKGGTFTFTVVSREDGKLMQTGWGAPVEMKITRSRTCLEMFPPSS